MGIISEELDHLRTLTQAINFGEAKYRAIFENSPDAVFLMRGDRFVECNLAAVELFGCKDKKDLINASPLWFSEEYQPNGTKSKDGAMAKIEASLKGFPQRFPWRHRTLSGEPFDVEVSLNQVKVEGLQYHIAVLRTDAKIMHYGNNKTEEIL